MLNVHLLEEGRPSRPKTSIPVVGIISLFILLLSTAFYFLCLFLPALQDMVNEYRVELVFLSNTFSWNGIEAMKFLICVPLSLLGALIGAINAHRMSRAKGFLGFLHILPIIGLVGAIIGGVLYFFFPNVLSLIPPEFLTLPDELLEWVFLYSIAAIAAGIAIADIFAIFYNHINYSEFRPIYKAYHYQLKVAPSNSSKREIRKQFRYLWRKQRYEDLLDLLFGANLDLACDDMLSPDAYAYLKEKALKNYLSMKEKELDSMYQTKQNLALRRELALLARGFSPESKEGLAAIQMEEDINKKDDSSASAKMTILPDDKPAREPTKKELKEIEKEKKRLEKERIKEAKEKRVAEKRRLQEKKQQAKDAKKNKPEEPSVPAPEPMEEPKPEATPEIEAIEAEENAFQRPNAEADLADTPLQEEE